MRFVSSAHSREVRYYRRVDDHNEASIWRGNGIHTVGDGQRCMAAWECIVDKVDEACIYQYTYMIVSIWPVRGAGMPKLEEQR